MPRWIATAPVALALLVASPAKAATPVTWAPLPFAPGYAPGIVDVAGPTTDGKLVTSDDAGIGLLGGAGLIHRTHDQGAGFYLPSAGEPYIAVTPKVRLPKARCSFHRDEVYVLGDNPDRIMRITRGWKAVDFFASLPSPFLSGITFDRVGTFGHRLLVTGTANNVTTLYALDCRGRVKTLTSRGPLVEGGLEVAPPGFGRFGGRLIGVDELSDTIYAFKPGGAARAVLRPGLAAGQDVGIEALGFVPRLTKRGAAFLADRSVAGNPHPGTDSILMLTAAQLRAAGVRAGDLLVATEGGAQTIDVRCRKGRGCRVRLIGQGPSVTHAEGHIAFRGIRQ